MCSQMHVTLLLLVFNIISFLFGVSVILIGVYQYAGELFDGSQVHVSEINSVKDHLCIYCTETIIVGTILVLVSIFGVISIKTNSIYFLRIYAAMNVMIIVGLIITCAIGYMRFDGAATKFMEKFVADNFNANKYHQRKEFIDNSQNLFQCCGNTGIHDYFSTPGNIPTSCCLDGDCSSQFIYSDGCNTKIPQLIEEHKSVFEDQKNIFFVIAGVAAVFGLAEGLLAFKLQTLVKSPEILSPS